MSFTITTNTPTRTFTVTESGESRTFTAYTGVGPTGADGAAGPNEVSSSTTSDGTADLYVETLSFNTANGPPAEMGELTWNSTSGSLELMLQNGVVAPLNESNLIRVRNSSGSTIAKGAPLVYTGTPGASGRLEVAAWTGANVSNARAFLGFAASEMDTGDNKDGYASWLSKIEGIATDGDDYGETWSDGDIIYAVPSASSTLTNVQPTTGEWVVAAAVINAGSGTSGSMFVRPSFDKAGFDQSLNTTDSPTFANLTASGTVLTTAMSLSALNALVPSPTAGMRATVNDSTVAAAENFGATITGGSANTVPAFYDGSNWIVG